MDITINGNLNINGDINYQENGSADETFKGLLDNEATFRDLLACLRERAQEHVLAADEDGEKEALVKANRCPGSEQLRSNHTLVAQITVGDATCEVYENGYAVFDNGDRKTVIWVPDCAKAARYYSPLTYDQKCKEEKRLRGEDEESDPETSKIVEGTESEEDRLDEEQLADMAWYLAIVIAGENRIERNLEHPLSAGNRSCKNAEDSISRGRYSWSCGARFQDPEDMVLYKEEKAERCADLTDKQREAYQLYYVDEFTQEEIAGMLGTSQRAISDRLEAVRRKIADYYDRYL